MKLRIGEAVLEAEAVPGGVRVRRDEVEVEFTCTDLGNGLFNVVGPAGAFIVWVSGARAGTRGSVVSVAREVRRGAGSASGAMTPPMPATVSRIFVAPGDLVVAGQPLLGLVAMKTEITLRSPHAGLVVAMLATIGQNVRPGDRLVQVDRDETR